MQLQSEALTALASTRNSPFQNQTTAATSQLDHTNRRSSFSGTSATEALAASYQSAARQHQRLQEYQGNKEGNYKGDHTSQQSGETGKFMENMIMKENSNKVRTQQEKADGRMLLGFLQELQNNHLKATMSLSNTAHDSVSTVPRLQSTNASSDGTAASCHSKRQNMLKKGYDISVKKDSDMETASSVSCFNSSVVPKSEALSGSSGGSSGGDSSDENKEGSSGDDAEKSIRTGPLRKRFRREFKSSAIAHDDDDEFQN